MSHPQVSHAPENPAKEGVEKTAHQGQKIGEEGNDFGDDKGDGPSDSQNGRPRHPADDRVRGFVLGALEDAEEDEACRDRGIQDAQEDQRGDHEGERNLLVNFVAERVEGWSRVVLCAGVAVDC